MWVGKAEKVYFDHIFDAASYRVLKWRILWCSLSYGQPSTARDLMLAICVHGKSSGAGEDYIEASKSVLKPGLFCPFPSLLVL